MAAALAFVLVAAACAGDEEGGGRDGAETDEALLQMAAEDAAAATSLPTSFEPWNPGPAPEPTPGLDFGAVTCLWSVPACKRLADALEEAASAIGWNPTVIDGTADPSNQRQAVSTFLGQGVDAMALAALEPSQLEDLLARAGDMDIPWVGMNMLNPEDFGAIGNIDLTGGVTRAGQQLGAWVANDSQGEARVLMMSSTDNPGLQLRDQGFQEYLAQFPGIEFVGETIYVPFADVGPPLEAQVQSILQANPDEGSIDYIYTPFDGFATFVVNGVVAADRPEIKVLGFDGSPPNLEFIREGRGQAASQATAWEWCSYLTMDELNRALHGEPFTDVGCPSIVFDQSNLPPEGEVFEGGEVDFRAAFEELWGKR